MKLYLFNPENDLALASEASGISNYTPPKGALTVGYRGALLPLWWSDEDDCILLPPRLAADELRIYNEEAQRLRDTYGLRGRVATPEELKSSGNCREATPIPWGWSRYARRRFEEAGVSPDYLPEDSLLTTFSFLSHRRTTVRLNQELKNHLVLNPPEGAVIVFPPLPAEVSCLDELSLHLQNYGRIMVKLPWSCSSRGIMKLSCEDINSCSSRLEGMIRRQGSIMVEKYLPVSATKSESPIGRTANDFAALFESDGRGEVRFRSWSVFKTDSNGRYSGNIVTSQEEIRKRIPVREEVKDWIVGILESALSDLLGHIYTGWMGVDMMVWDPGEERVGIAPCLELNLRQTMGVAAWRIANRNLFDCPMILNATDKGVSLVPEGSDAL